MFKQWPPDPARKERYDRWQLLYEGDHNLAFAEELALRYYDKEGDELTYIRLSYPALVVNVASNLLVGEPPIVSYPSERTDYVEALQELMKDSDWKTLLQELCQEAGSKGDAVLVVREAAEGVVIEPKPAYVYWPTLHPDNCREVLEEVLAWQREWMGQRVVRVDRYEPGQIVREAYLLDGTKLTRRLPDSAVEEMCGGPVVVPTGVSDRRTLVHFPNLRSASSYFGYSDYDFGIASLFEEANRRITQIAVILDRHADPIMAGMDLRDPNGNINLLKGNYMILPKGGTAPQYLTWNSELKAAFEELRLILEEIYRQTEISPVLAGYVAGASYDSSRAFRMQLIQTLAKMTRKRNYLEAALKKAIRLAMAIILGIPYADTLEPEIKWRDPLPKDLAEAVQTESTATAAGLTSKLDAIMRLWDCDENAAKSILERINEEKGSDPTPQPMAAPEPPQMTPEGLEPDGSEESE